MDELLKSLRSPAWWVGVVLVGVITSIIAAFVKPWLDRMLLSVLRWRSTRTLLRREQFEKRVLAALASDAEESRLRFETLRSLLTGIFYFLVGSLGAALGVLFKITTHARFLALVPLIIGLIPITWCVQELFGNDSYDVLAEVERRRKTAAQMDALPRE